MPMPQVPGPEELEPTAGPAAAAARVRRRMTIGRDSPIEMRHVGPLSIEVERDPSLAADSNIVWLRADGELPDDPLLHVCLMTYASDMTLLDTVLHAHAGVLVGPHHRGASLDHAMWFHRPFRADEWLLYVQDSPSATGGRGLARGEVYTDGRRARRVRGAGGSAAAADRADNGPAAVWPRRSRR